MTYDGSVMDMVTQSPAEILIQHMQKVRACTDLLPEFIRSMQAENWDEAETIFAKIKCLEHEADQLKAKTRAVLRKDLFLPMAKSELLSLVMLQDGLANQARDICGIMIGRQMTLPKQVAQEFLHYTETVVQACTQACDTLVELNNIFEAVFSKQAVEVIEEKFSELEALESQTDLMQIDIRQKLYHIEDTMAPVAVFFLYKIIHLLGQLADQAERVGQHLLLCVTD